MRLRLQTLFPVAAGVLVAAGFLLAATSVGNAVREALLTVPGITRERAVGDAVAAVTMAGVVVTVIAVIMSALVAHMITHPLRRLRRAATRITGPEPPADFRSSLGEIQDLAHGFNRAARELRDRHEHTLRERIELRKLVDAVSEGILQVDAGGRIIRVNPAGRAILGLPTEAVGQPVSAVLRHAPLRSLMERALRGDHDSAAELTLDDRRILASVAPQDGGGVVATFVDLTDLRRLEEVRRDFVANASHELKTPLTSIRGYTDTLLTADLDEEDRSRFLATISRNADRLQRIVDDLLDLSRLESGRWEPDLQRVAVRAAVRTSWAPFAGRAGDASVTFSNEAGIDHTVRADPNGLEHVLTNLFDNALRYTSPGGRIAVTTRSDESAPDPTGGHRGPDASRHPTGPWIVIEVSDTGVGIPRDAIARIFERFYRVDPARSRAEGGTGLGLSIVKHLVESMGGAIRAHSELGKGTTMAVWLRPADHDLP